MADFVEAEERGNDLDLLFQRCADLMASDPGFILKLSFLHTTTVEDIQKVVERMGKCVIDIGDGLTLLHQAAQFNRVDIAHYLIKEAGHPVEVKTINGETPLDQAAWRGCIDVAVFLLRCGADIDCQTKSLYTPLHRCAFYGHDRMAALLRLAGADQKLKDKDGHTAYNVAVERQQHPKLLSLLKPVVDSHGNDLTGIAYARNNPKHPQHRREGREAFFRLFAMEAMAASGDAGAEEATEATEPGDASGAAPSSTDAGEAAAATPVPAADTDTDSAVDH